MYRNNTESSLLCFRGNAFSIYRIVDSDVYMSATQRERSTVLPWQLQLREHVTMSRYTYIHYVLCDQFNS